MYLNWVNLGELPAPVYQVEAPLMQTLIGIQNLLADFANMKLGEEPMPEVEAVDPAWIRDQLER